MRNSAMDTITCELQEETERAIKVITQDCEIDLKLYLINSYHILKKAETSTNLLL